MSDFTEHMLSNLYTRVERKLNIRMPQATKLLRIIEGLKIQVDRMCTGRRQRIYITYTACQRRLKWWPRVIMNEDDVLLGRPEELGFLIAVPMHHRDRERVWYV